MAYHTLSGPKVGPILKSHGHHAITIISDPDRPWSTVGFALPVGRPGDRLEVWRLIVDGKEVPGRWVVIDRAFHPAQQNGREPR